MYIQYQYGRTALHWAVEGGHADCVRLLARAGVDMEAIQDVRQDHV